MAKYKFKCSDNVKIIITGEIDKINGMSWDFKTNKYKYSLKSRDRYFTEEELLKLPKDPEPKKIIPVIESEKVIKLRTKQERENKKLRGDRWHSLFDEIIDRLFDDDYGLYQTDSEVFYPRARVCQVTGSVIITVTPESKSFKMRDD